MEVFLIYMSLVFVIIGCGTAFTEIMMSFFD